MDARVLFRDEPGGLSGLKAAQAYLRFPVIHGVNLRANFLSMMTAVASQCEPGYGKRRLWELVGPLDTPKVVASAVLFYTAASAMDPPDRPIIEVLPSSP